MRTTRKKPTKEQHDRAMRRQRARRAARKGNVVRARKGNSKRRLRTRQRAAAARSAAGRAAAATRVYHLTNGLPDRPRPGTQRRAVLEHLKAEGEATAAQLAVALPKISAPTLTRYLCSLKRMGVINY